MLKTYLEEKIYREDDMDILLNFLLMHIAAELFSINSEINQSLSIL